MSVTENMKMITDIASELVKPYNLKHSIMDKILDEAEKRVERMASEYAYRQTEGITDKNVQSVTFLMIKDNIVRGSRMMREAINDLKKRVMNNNLRVEQAAIKDYIEGCEDTYNLLESEYVDIFMRGAKWREKNPIHLDPKKQGLTIDIQLSELAGYEFYIDGQKINYEDMTREQQIKVLNSFSQGYNLFVRFLKEK